MLDRRQFFGATAVLAVGVLAACAQPQSEPATVAVIVEDAWVRTTDGAANTMMTAAFMSIVNPSDAEVKLVSATCDGAGKVELHHMVTRDGKKVMEPVPELPVPAGKHIHLTPGGMHIMLMQLRREFKVGDEVELELKFSTGQTVKVVAPAKQSAEEDEHYHPGDPTPGQMGSPTPTRSENPTTPPTGAPPTSAPPTSSPPSTPAQSPTQPPATSSTGSAPQSNPPSSKRTGRY